MPLDPPSHHGRVSRFPALLLACLVAGICSCRSDVVGPKSVRTSATPMPVDVTSPEPGEGTDLDRVPPQVPEITSVRAFVRGDSLHIRGQLGTSASLRPYEPVRPGGWALQILVDSDLTNGGYWLGFDYVVRGSEWSRDQRTFVTRRITLEPEYPGGWGPQSGVALFRQRPRHFEVAIPLASIGGFTHDLFLAIETFATVGCASCPNGYAHESTQLVFHSLSDPSAAVFDPSTRRRGVFVEWSRRDRASGMDADPRLARRAR
jgi:hypothetical protein